MISVCAKIMVKVEDVRGKMENVERSEIPISRERMHNSK